MALSRLGTSLILFLLLLVGLGCDSIPAQIVKHSNTGPGYVRTFWAHACYSVTFEQADGQVRVYEFDSQPAVWAGMHAVIYYKYDSYAGGCPFTPETVTRLP